jgi:hypothetical protein
VVPELAPDGSWFPVLEAIGSLEELHVLLSLADAGVRVWTMAELAARHPTIDVPEAVGALMAAQLAWRDGDRGIGLTVDRDLRRGAVALVAQYRSNPLLILNPLTERALDRVRNAAARTFADAFVVKRDKKSE